MERAAPGGGGAGVRASSERSDLSLSAAALQPPVRKGFPSRSPPLNPRSPAFVPTQFSPSLRPASIPKKSPAWHPVSHAHHGEEDWMRRVEQPMSELRLSSSPIKPAPTPPPLTAEQLAALSAPARMDREVRVLQQLDYIFSEHNFRGDKHLHTVMKMHNGWVPLSVLVGYKIKKGGLRAGVEEIANAIEHQDALFRERGVQSPVMKLSPDRQMLWPQLDPKHAHPQGPHPNEPIVSSVKPIRTHPAAVAELRSSPSPKKPSPSQAAPQAIIADQRRPRPVATPPPMPAPSSSPTVPLTPEQRLEREAKILGHLDWLFSDQNLPADSHLQNVMLMHDGWVPLTVLTGYKIRKGMGPRPTLDEMVATLEDQSVLRRDRGVAGAPIALSADKQMLRAPVQRRPSPGTGVFAGIGGADKPPTGRHLTSDARGDRYTPSPKIPSPSDVPAEPQQTQSPAHQMTPEQRLEREAKILGHLDWLFSDQNLPADSHLQMIMADHNGWVPLGQLIGYKAKKAGLGRCSVEELASAIERQAVIRRSRNDLGLTAAVLELSPDREMLQVLPDASAHRTVVLDRLARGTNTDTLLGMLLPFGHVEALNVVSSSPTPHGRSPSRPSRQPSPDQARAQGDLMAFARFELPVCAEAAVTELNNTLKNNWRDPMRVYLKSSPPSKHKQPGKPERSPTLRPTTQMPLQPQAQHPPMAELQLGASGSPLNTASKKKPAQQQRPQERDSFYDNKERMSPRSAQQRPTLGRWGRGTGAAPPVQPSSSPDLSLSSSPSNKRSLGFRQAKGPDGSGGFPAGRGRPLSLPPPTNQQPE